MLNFGDYCRTLRLSELVLLSTDGPKRFDLEWWDISAGEWKKQILEAIEEFLCRVVHLMDTDLVEMLKDMKKDLDFLCRYNRLHFKKHGSIFVIW